VNCMQPWVTEVKMVIALQFTVVDSDKKIMPKKYIIAEILLNYWIQYDLMLNVLISG
jgi:hypothetical protein